MIVVHQRRKPLGMDGRASVEYAFENTCLNHGQYGRLFTLSLPYLSVHTTYTPHLQSLGMFCTTCLSNSLRRYRGLYLLIHCRAFFIIPGITYQQILGTM